jgi:threonine aldolase
MTQRLEDDHQHAQLLAQGLSNISGVVLDPNTPQTNMVFLSLAEGVPFSADEVATELAKKMIRVGVTGSRRFRLVTHYWIDELGIQRTIEAFKSLLG